MLCEWSSTLCSEGISDAARSCYPAACPGSGGHHNRRRRVGVAAMMPEPELVAFLGTFALLAFLGVFVLLLALIAFLERQ